jgi:hypothetical protein
MRLWEGVVVVRSVDDRLVPLPDQREGEVHDQLLCASDPEVWVDERHSKLLHKYKTTRYRHNHVYILGYSYSSIEGFTGISGSLEVALSVVLCKSGFP